MPIIERNENNEEYVEKLYESNIIKFENTILKSDQYTYSISYFPKDDIYDVVLEDDLNNRLINYEVRRKLSNSTLKYFNMYKEDAVEDNFGNKFKCITHYIEI